MVNCLNSYLLAGDSTYVCNNRAEWEGSAECSKPSISLNYAVTFNHTLIIAFSGNKFTISIVKLGITY